MKVQVVGNRIRLKDLRAGKIAVCNEGKVYTRVYTPDCEKANTMLIRLDQLDCQYNDMIKGHTPVRELTEGEQVVLEI